MAIFLHLRCQFSRSSPINCYQLIAVNSLLSIRCYQLIAVNSLLSIRCYQLVAISPLLPIHRHSSIATNLLLLTSCYPLIIICLSTAARHTSLLIHCYSFVTTHFFLPIHLYLSIHRCPAYIATLSLLPIRLLPIQLPIRYHPYLFSTSLSVSSSSIFYAIRSYLNHKDNVDSPILQYTSATFSFSTP